MLEKLTLNDNINLIKVNSLEKEKTLDYLNLRNLENNNIDNFSGGEKKRVQILREIGKISHIYLCDEITSGLDDENIKKVYNILAKLSETSLIIISSHDDNIDDLIKVDEVLLFQNESVTIISQIKRDEISQDNYSNNYKVSREVKNHIIKKYKQGNNGKLILMCFALFIFTFLLFLLASLSNINFEKVEEQSFKDNSSNIIYISNGKQKLSENLKNITNLNNIRVIKKIYELQLDNNYMRLDLNYLPQDNIYYNNYWFLNYLEETDNINNYSLLVGNSPSKENEILIYQYLADNILKHGAYVEDEQEKVLRTFLNYENIIGETFYIENIPIKIVGIIKQDINKYESLKSTPIDYQNQLNGEYHISLFANEIADQSAGFVVTKEFSSYLNSFSKHIEKELKKVVVEIEDKNKIDTTLKDISKLELKSKSIYQDSLDILNKKYMKYQPLFFYGFILSVIVIITLIFYFIDSIIKKQKNIEKVFHFLGVPFLTSYQIEWVTNMRFLILIYIISLFSFMVSISIMNNLLCNVFGFKIKLIQIPIIYLFLITIIVFFTISFIIYIIGNKYIF